MTTTRSIPDPTESLLLHEDQFDSSPDRRAGRLDRRNRGVGARWDDAAIPRVSVVIPTLNEARNLRHVLPRIPDWVDEVIIVDGRSTDDTVAEARRLRPDVIVVHDQEPGKGRALMTGLHASTGEILVTLDADGSMSPDEIPRYVYGLLSGADFVKGSRFVHGGATEDMSLLRKLGNRGLTEIVRRCYGGRFTDLCYGYNACWRDVLPYLEGRAPGFEIETHMNVRALGAGLRVLEVPSFEAERVHGASNLRTFRDGFRVLRTIVRERSRFHRCTLPRPDAGRRAHDLPGPTDARCEPSAPGVDAGLGRALSVSVVICTHDPARWDLLVNAVNSARDQTVVPVEVVVVVDHHDTLLRRAQAEFDNVRVVPSSGRPGLSGARNAAVALAAGDVVAFLDDDARADPDWIERLLDAYDAPDVLAVGGAVLPRWESRRPSWLPEEFDWVVGCTYRGLPELRAPVRNLVGANMSFRRSVLVGLDGFDADLGRKGHDAAGCEETELCIRATAAHPGGRIVFEPSARVWHHVPDIRANWDYFVARCLAEGRSKARVADRATPQRALSSERAYVARTLPAGVVRSIGRSFHREPGAVRSAFTTVAGVALVGTSYVQARRAGRSPRPSPWVR